jgi:Protein of unknown function (DUF3108)
MALSRWASSLLLAAAALPAQAQLPARVEIVYEVQRNGSTMAEISALLEHADGRYKLVEKWQGRGMYALLGKATRTSIGSLGTNGVRPAEFTDERSGRDTARAWLDWKTGTMTMRYKGRSRSEAIPPNAQDRISFMLALAVAPAGAKTGDYHLVDGRGVSHHIYQFAGRERVQTPAGTFDAVKVVRGRDDDKAEFWLATALGGLPVRMLAVEKGARWDQIATRIER